MLLSPAATAAGGSRPVVNDWLQHPELLPPRPQTFIEEKYTQLFAVDLQGKPFHDQYVFVAPNGVAVVGLAPSHLLIAAHRRANGYQPIALQYKPPCMDGLQPEDLALAIDDRREDGEADDEGAGGAARSATAVEAADGDDAGPQPTAAAAHNSSLPDADTPMTDAGGEHSSSQAPTEVANASSGPSPDGSGPGRPEDGTSTATAAPPAPAFTADELKCVNYEIGGRDLSRAKLSGKRRNQGSYMQPTSIVARLEGSSGASVPVYAVASGQLLEVNTQLQSKPRLLFDRPCREGHVAVLYPNPAQLQRLKAQLLTAQEYLQLRNLMPEDLL